MIGGHAREVRIDRDPKALPDAVGRRRGIELPQDQVRRDQAHDAGEHIGDGRAVSPHPVIMARVIQ
jgi:hypothetical protein